MTNGNGIAALIYLTGIILPKFKILCYSPVLIKFKSQINQLCLLKVYINHLYFYNKYVSKSTRRCLLWHFQTQAGERNGMLGLITFKTEHVSSVDNTMVTSFVKAVFTVLKLSKSILIIFRL